MTTSGARSHEARSAAARAPVAPSHAVGARGLIDRDDASELDERASETDLVSRCVNGDGAAAHALHERY